MEVHTINGSCYVKCVDVNSLEQDHNELKADCEFLRKHVARLIDMYDESNVILEVPEVLVDVLRSLIEQTPNQSLIEIQTKAITDVLELAYPDGAIYTADVAGHLGAFKNKILACTENYISKDSK